MFLNRCLVILLVQFPVALRCLHGPTFHVGYDTPSFLLLNISDQSLFSNAHHRYFLSMLVLLRLFPPYMSFRCDSLSGDVFCPIVSRVAARDNRRRRMERLRSSRSLIYGSCQSV
jgi:hypothetical protein